MLFQSDITMFYYASNVLTRTPIIIQWLITIYCRCKYRHQNNIMQSMHTMQNLKYNGCYYNIFLLQRNTNMSSTYKLHSIVTSTLSGKVITAFATGPYSRSRVTV